ncbi:MAG: EamA family transporter [Methylophaga sp.]|nr:EamA family transporter [Methylophaga sp.]
MELLLVLARIGSAAVANVFQKQLANNKLHPLFIVMSSYGLLTLFCLPLLWWLPSASLDSTFWLNIILAAMLDMAGTLFLVMSLSRTDLSVFGPLNAYKVVISMLLAMLLLNEIPNLQGLTGVLIIIAGSFLLIPASSITSGNRIWQLLSDRGVQYRFLSIALFSIGTLPLKNAVVSGGALATTVFWCLFGLPLAVLVYQIFSPHSWRNDTIHFSQQRYALLGLAILILVMQFTTLLLLSKMLIAYALALFQLSMVLQVFLGARIFREAHFRTRLMACLVMVMGSLLVLYA